MGLVMLPYLELEEKYAKFVGTQYACATNTGTAALHLAIEALEMPNDTQVIVPDFTMYASGLAVHYARLTPVFIDCTKDLLIDLDKVERQYAELVGILADKQNIKSFDIKDYSAIDPDTKNM